MNIDEIQPVLENLLNLFSFSFPEKAVVYKNSCKIISDSLSDKN